VPCKEFTKAGFANDMEKRSNISEIIPVVCPPRNIRPFLEKKLMAGPLEVIIFFLIFGTSSINKQRGSKTSLDQIMVEKKSKLKYACLKII